MTRWRNWARSASADFAAVAVPADEAELGAVLTGAADRGQRIRPLGSGHSFTPLGVTDGVSLRLDHFTGVRAADPATGLVTVGAGTRLRDVPALLDPLGLALENMGDIDAQTIAGAVSTGTHGTGAAFTGFAGQVRGFRMVLADGSVLDCSAEHNAEVFHAAVVGLGAFGVLTEVTLACVPSFGLAADEHPEPLPAVLEGFAERMTATDHVEFYWFPHTEVALIKSNTRVPATDATAPIPRWRSLIDDELMSNGVFAGTCAVGSVAPAAIPVVNRVAAQLVSARRYSDVSYAVFTSPRRVRFREMEYAVRRADLPDVLREIDLLIKRKGWRISFPLEIRVAAADDRWLSTAYGRESAYVAVHRYHREPFAEYFLAVQEILKAADGRPHWGKLHTLDAQALAARYPRFTDAQQLRRRLDPCGLFTNAHLARVLG